MSCHFEPQQLPPAVTQDQEHEQEIKGQRRHNAHIDGSNRLSVISQKVFQGCDGSFEGRAIYFETVD